MLIISQSVRNMAFNREVDVVIVGGGPGGLVLAHSCFYHKLSFVLLEKNIEPGELSKATGIHCRSMEYLSIFNLSNDILRHAVRLDRAVIFLDGNITKRIEFSHGSKVDIQNVSLSQKVFEEILVSKLPQESVFYGCEVLDFHDSNDSVTVQAKDVQTGEIKTFKSRYLAAADGGKSLIRKRLHIDFPGETNPELALSFDAKLCSTIEPNTMRMYNGQQGRLVFVPISNDGKYKVSGLIGGFSETLSTNDMVEIAKTRSDLCVVEETIRNRTFYRLHARIADCFRCGNICLLGDAAHVFYPDGGYGLNMAIEDAVYLGETIHVAVQYGRKEVLDDYAHYRREVALLVKNDATKKRVQSMDEKAENNNEKQVYQSEQYQTLNYENFLVNISKYKITLKNL